MSKDSPSISAFPADLNNGLYKNSTLAFSFEEHSTCCLFERFHIKRGTWNSYFNDKYEMLFHIYTNEQNVPGCKNFKEKMASTN